MSAPDGGPNNRRTGDGPLLTELGADLRKVRTDTENTRRDVREVAGVVAELAPQVEQHGKDLAELRGVVEALASDEPEAANPPVEWPALAAEEAEREWDALYAWITDVLVPWFGLTRGQLPDCWAMHRRAVFELTWLKTCYRQAYMRKAHPTSAAEWHTRWLDAALANIADAIPATWCRPGEHHVHSHESQQRRQQQPQHAGSGAGQAVGGQQPPPWMAQQQQPAQVYHQETEKDQLAEVKHWGDWWAQAKEADLAWRREREQQAVSRLRPGKAD